MKIEVCDLCNARVHDLNKTEVTITDHKGMTIDFGRAFPAKRKFKGVICDDCLNLLKAKVKVKNKEV